jgi:hypothetical protein
MHGRFGLGILAWNEDNSSLRGHWRCDHGVLYAVIVDCGALEEAA